MLMSKHCIPLLFLTSVCYLKYYFSCSFKEGSDEKEARETEQLIQEELMISSVCFSILYASVNCPLSSMSFAYLHIK